MKELINVNIKNENGKLLVSSIDIAKGLEKEHKDILRKIRKVLDRNEYFISTYTDKKGEIRPQYFMNKNSLAELKRDRRQKMSKGKEIKRIKNHV